MPLSSKYPYYGPLGSGNYNVSLAFFGPTSEVSKSIGLNSSTGLSLPNTDFIQKFAEGNLGISDSFIKNMIFKNMNNPIASKNEDIFKHFAKLNNIDVSDIDKYKKGNSFSIPKDQIKLPDTMTGFSSFEKATLQSIFDTQKPFMEIVGIAIGSVVKAEDVIARVMPFFGNPLKVKSRKPVGNSGSGSSRPKAIGYKGAKETKETLRRLNAIQASTVKTDDTIKNININTDIKNQSENSSEFNTSSYWKVLSTVYSTGIFEPNIDYKYSYINLPADQDLPEVDPVVIEDYDPYDNYKPKSIIFGIYNSKGEVVDPSEYLKTIGLKGNNRIEETTPFKRADWLLRSPKWKLPEGMIEWPTFETPNYVWEKHDIFTKEITRKISKKSPGIEYFIKRYKVGDKDILTKNPAIPKDPMIESFDKIEYDNYTRYYNDLIDIGLNATELSKEERILTNKDINDRLEIKTQVEQAFLYGHTKASVYNKVNNKDAFPEFMKKSYKPFQIFNEEAAKDQELIKLAIQRGNKPGLVWVDPEADYDMKVIRVDPVSSIEYLESQGQPEIKTSIRQFVKNITKFSFSNGMTFSISISKNVKDVETFNNVSEYSLENWNYENNKIKTNNYIVNIWSDTAPGKFTNNHYSWTIKKPPLVITRPSFTTFGLSSSTITYTLPPDNYSITKIDGIWHYRSTAANYIKNGINKLGDTNQAVYSEDGIIKKWYYMFDEDFKDPTKYSLPPFGIERRIIINYENDNVDTKDKTIPLWRLRVDNKFNSVIIDPIQITNNFLTTTELFINDDWYGHGDTDDKQTLGIIKRYALTDLDTESYYIVEGILKNENEFETDDDGKRLNNGRGKGGGWYRLPHAIGACGVFIRLLINIAVKLLPKIKKLITLFKNPSVFVTNIMTEKLSKNFEFLTSDALATFQKASQLKSSIADKDIDIESVNKNIDNIRIEARRKSEKIISECKSDVELSSVRGTVKSIKNEAEKEVRKLQRVVNKKREAVSKLRNHYKNSILSNYVYVDDLSLDTIFTLDGAATIPLSVLGTKLNFGMSMNMGSVPSKPPLKLIFPDSRNLFKNVQYLIDNAKPTSINANQPASSIIKQEIIDLNTPIKSQLSALDRQPPFTNQTIDFNDINKVQIKFEDGSVQYISKDSLQSFVLTNQDKYNFIYVTENLNSIFVDVDLLIQNGTQEDLDIAKEKLEDAKKNFPNDSAIDDKIKELNKKNELLSKNVQPLLKVMLGLVTFPIKIVADILKWMFDFFKSITNPMKLASKMKEFLSFKWILQFFTPTGILNIFGLKFNPLSLVPYAAIAAVAKGKSGIKSPGMADMSKYINVSIIPTLPTYTADQYKNLLKGMQPLRLLTILQMLQKFINAVIDFIWSLFGIEALIKPPHIKIVPEDTTNISPEDIKKILDNIDNNLEPETSINPITGEIDTTSPIQSFIYEVKLPDGTTKSFLDINNLNEFIETNKEFNYNFTF